MSAARRVMNRVSAGLIAIASGANAIGTIVVLILVLVLNADVVARGVFNDPFHGVHEVVQFSMVLIVYLQLPDVIRVDRLTRSDGFYALIGDKCPSVGLLLGRLIDSGAAIIMVLIAVAMWPEFVDAWETNHFFGTPGIFTAPWWPVRLVIVFSAVLCALILIAKVIIGGRVLTTTVVEHDSRHE